MGRVTIQSIRFYCDTEDFMYGKKYRTVFRQKECSSIYAEVILYKEYQYMQEDLDCTVKFTIQGPDESCILEKDLNVLIGEGETEQTGTIILLEDSSLPLGNYLVTAEAEETPETEKTEELDDSIANCFDIINIPEDYGECFALEDFSFYRRNRGEEVTDYRRNTLTSFSFENLEAIECVFVARNKLSYSWNSEFFISVFDQTGTLKSIDIEKGEPLDLGEPDQFHFILSFGDGQLTWWRKGNYRVEVVFMNELIIEAPLTIGDKDIEIQFSPGAVMPGRYHGGKQIVAASLLNLNAMEEIESMIGLHQLKKELKRYVDRVKYNEARKRAGYAIKPVSLHSVYLGNPGTGKTTVARLMGKVFHDLGLLSKGHVVIEERNSLTGKFYGSEEERTNQALERAKGGVLFIDEAYTLLVKEDPKDPGRRIMETLLTTLSDESKRDICVILAGYPNPMIDMLNENPGMKSRLPNIYHFDDYNAEELIQIADKYMTTNQYIMTKEARMALQATVEKACGKRDDKFGNARYIISMLENRIIPNLASRLVAAGNMEQIEQTEQLLCIEQEDIENTETEIKDVDYFKQKRKNVGFR